MTFDIAIVLIVVGIGFLLFAFEILAAEIVGLLSLVALVFTGVLDADDAFRGFGSPALIMIAGVLVLSASLIQNGAAERIAQRIRLFSGGGSEQMIFALLSAVTATSAFLNNVATVAMYMPVAESLSRGYRIRPSRLLMPIAFAALLGGVCTLTGTSTNVAVAGALAERGFAPIGMFELSPIGIPIAIVGMFYLVAVSRWLPGRAGDAESVGEDQTADHRLFMTELIVPEESEAIGVTLRELDLAHKHHLTPFGVLRGDQRITEDVFDTELLKDDVVIVEGDARAINRGGSAAGLRRKRTSKIIPTVQTSALVEATISYNSPMIGRTLRELDFRGRYGLDVIALWRRGGAVVEKVGDIQLRLGDDLLVQGPIERTRKLAGDPLYLLLNDRVLPRYQKGKEMLSVLIFALALLAGATELVPITIAFVAGSLALILTGCLTTEEAYRALNLKLIMLIGAMTGVAKAMEVSGAAAWLAGHVVDWTAGSASAPLLVLAALFWLTVLLTQPMSNAAAALLVLPVALSAANTLGLDPRAFAIGVTVAASINFMTPLEPSCLLVMSTGRYRFRDFLAFGTPLTLIAFAMAMVLIPWFFPFHGQ